MRKASEIEQDVKIIAELSDRIRVLRIETEKMNNEIAILRQRLRFELVKDERSDHDD